MNASVTLHISRALVISDIAHKSELQEESHLPGGGGELGGKGGFGGLGGGGAASATGTQSQEVRITSEQKQQVKKSTSTESAPIPHFGG